MINNYFIFIASLFMVSAAMAEVKTSPPASTVVATPAKAGAVSLAPAATASKTPSSEKPMSPEAVQKFEQENYYGRAVRNEQGELLYVEENAKQIHSKDDYVMVHVKNIKNAKGRVRVAIWNKPDNYGKEDRAPFRAVSFPASESKNKMMVFKIGVEKEGPFSYFGHHNEKDNGKVNRILGIPTEDFGFTSKATQGKGKGLKRDGLSPPPYEQTLVNYTGPGQVIEINL